MDDTRINHTAKKYESHRPTVENAAGNANRKC